MIRFRMSGYTIGSCTLLFWGTEEITFMANSVDNRIISLKVSAHELYENFINRMDEEFNKIELL